MDQHLVQIISEELHRIISEEEFVLTKQIIKKEKKKKCSILGKSLEALCKIILVNV